MDSPNDPYNVDPEDNVYRFLDDYCPSPLIHPPVDPPPSPNMFNVPTSAPNVDTTTTTSNHGDYNDFEFDIDVDDIINFGPDLDDNAEGGSEPPAAAAVAMKDPPAPDAGPSGTKELGFQWAPPGALDCGGCTVVSEVYDYSNGLYNIRLAVHAVAGNFDHLVFDVESTDFEISSGVETFLMNFEGQSLELMNSSLAKYAIKINEDGSITLQDSYIAVYNHILEKQVVSRQQGGGSTSSQQTSDSNEENTDIEEATNEQMSSQPPGLNQGCLELQWMNGPGESSGAASANNDGDASRHPPPQRPSVGIQRERTANMSIADLVPFFHMKAEDASKMLNICPTTLKILCRKLELGRWPHRKVKSIDNRIKRLKRQIREKAEERDMQAIAGLQDEIKKEEDKKLRLYAFLTRPR